MGSRIRENVNHLFECFCEIVKPGPDDKSGWIIQKFPEKYNDEEVLKSVPKFAYPCIFDNSVVQHYSFVLTSVDSKWTFGFCRHDPKSETALVLLSYLPWHESFYKLLNNISELINHGSTDLLCPFLNSVYTSKVPDPGYSLEVPLNNEKKSIFICNAPKPFQLPTIPQNRNLTEYYNAIDCDIMITVFASMLFERRIVFTSKKLYRLSSCVQAANAVIYPMNWQHIFIPVLPQQLIDYLLAPMPYLIGVPNALIDTVRKPDIGEIVILDADNNTVETPFDDLASLPQHVVKQLRNDLKNRAALLGDGVSRAFLRALVQLIGGYRDALKFHQGESITFDKEAFVQSRPQSMQSFLKKMLHLQIFQQFIEDRLTLLNAGLGFSDEFELEACNYCDKTSSKFKAQYKDWTHTMKRESTAFFKTVKTKANPAMKSAVKTVKERSKDVGKAYKGIKSKLKDFGDDKGRPRSHFLSTTTTNYRKDLLRKTSGPDLRSEAPYSALSSPEHDLRLSPLDMDLMGDLQDVLFRKSSLLEPPVLPERNLKPVRSLENFSGESRSRFDKTLFRNDIAGGSDDSVFLLGNNNNNNNTLKSSMGGSQKLSSFHKLEKINSTNSDTQDLIRLDSTPSGDELDPLSNGQDSPPLSSISLSNPLYPYYSTTNGSAKDLDLLKEYGIDFDELSINVTEANGDLLVNENIDISSTSSVGKKNSDGFTIQPVRPAASPIHWTKFE